MPVGFFHGASGDAETRAGSTRTIGALLARGRIVARQNPFDDKVDALGITFVAQEESLLTIADEKESVVGNTRSWFCGHSTITPSVIGITLGSSSGFVKSKPGVVRGAAACT
jgi:hypothetical protein